MKFWVGIVIPKKAVKEIREIQKSLSKKYKTYRCIKSFFGPHITLTIQTKIDYKDIRKMEKDVLEISKKMKPFDVRINGFGKFEESKSINAKVRKDRQIKTLNKKLVGKLKKYGNLKYDNFKPHVTLAFFEKSEENFREALNDIKKKKLTADFKLEKLSIAKGKTNGRMKIYKEIKLY